MADSFTIKTIRVGDTVEVVDGKPQFETKVLEVTHTETKVESYTLAQIDRTIANIRQELANAQARLDYQYTLRAELAK